MFNPDNNEQPSFEPKLNWSPFDYMDDNKLFFSGKGQSSLESIEKDRKSIDDLSSSNNKQSSLEPIEEDYNPIGGCSFSNNKQSSLEPIVDSKQEEDKKHKLRELVNVLSEVAKKKEEVIHEESLMNTDSVSENGNRSRSFADELRKSNNGNKSVLDSWKRNADELLSGIKDICWARKDKHRIKGYLACYINETGSEYRLIPNPELPPRQKGIYNRITTKEYYPEPWGGPVFSYPKEVMDYIESEVSNLGFKDYVFKFERIELEKAAPGFLNKITYRKSGEYAYFIYLELSW